MTNKNSVPVTGYAVSTMRSDTRVLDLDLNLNTAGKLELHQSVNSFSS